MYGDGVGNVEDMPQVHFSAACNLGVSIGLEFRALLGVVETDWTALTQNDLIGGEMKHLQVWMKPSTPGVHDGATLVYLDGVQMARSNDLLSIMPDAGMWNSVRLGYFVAHDGGGDLGCTPSGDAYTYWDDVYLDNTQARVELGNAPTYSACNHREIQIPTAWSPTTVSIRFNQGTFQTGQTAYLFVVTADGAESPGFQVTIGGGDPIGPPGRPGKPVFDD